MLCTMVMEGNIMMNKYNEMKSFQQCKRKRDSLGITGNSRDETDTFVSQLQSA